MGGVGLLLTLLFGFWVERESCFLLRLLLLLLRLPLLLLALLPQQRGRYVLREGESKEGKGPRRSVGL